MSRGFVILIARPVAHPPQLTEKRLARQSLVSQKLQDRTNCRHPGLTTTSALEKTLMGFKGMECHNLQMKFTGPVRTYFRHELDIPS